jgi:hypothetical protein
MPWLSRLLGFAWQVPLGFCIPIVALIVFARIGGGPIVPLFGGAPLDGVIGAVLAIAVLAAGVRFGWSKGRRGILLGMLLCASLIVLVIGSCYWDAARHS